MELSPADIAFRKFIQCAHREHGRWQLLRDQLKPLWRSLSEYEEMYAQVTRENADLLFGENEFEDSLLINLEMKLETARQDDLKTASTTIQDMRSVFHNIRSALVQLEYDLKPLESIVVSDGATNLRPAYGEMRDTCYNLLQGLWQDVSEGEYCLEMMTAHLPLSSPAVQDQFSEMLLRFMLPLKPYMAEMGVNLDSPKTLLSTPKSSRVSLP
ncbi:uncharacterized protein LOC100899208 [Galendromus occidentalis]|uniref:Uncharacterized protein LOC100899208 n=1 Tax=Galendromus occidentalis TaxID=34638 RepID=A0AAJ6QPJ1_9ACAR|nr:uncharacterized protein LOC100899208 [Galendromus occidentalis]